jgi:transcription elongation factor Elf1
MNGCPKCGGVSGFSYNLTLVTERRGDWGVDNDEEVVIRYTNNPKTVACNDCGARINMDVAHGTEKSHSKIWAKD